MFFNGLYSYKYQRHKENYHLRVTLPLRARKCYDGGGMNQPRALIVLSIHGRVAPAFSHIAPRGFSISLATEASSKRSGMLASTVLS